MIFSQIIHILPQIPYIIKHINVRLANLLKDARNKGGSFTTWDDKLSNCVILTSLSTGHCNVKHVNNFLFTGIKITTIFLFNIHREYDKTFKLSLPFANEILTNCDFIRSSIYISPVKSASRDEVLPRENHPHIVS